MGAQLGPNGLPLAGSAEPRVSHRDLLSAVGSLEQAALSRDVDSVHQLMCQLRSGLVAHLAAEEPMFRALPPATRAAVEAGQRRLRRRLDDLLGQVETDADGCRCLVEAAGLARLLAQQARLELALSSSSAVVEATRDQGPAAGADQGRSGQMIL